jgi:tetratricopeptide (TPR) repeat protein
MRRAPNYSDAQVALIDAEFWSGNHARALTLANQSLQRFPSNQDLLFRKAKVLAALGKNQESLDALERLLRLNPSSVDGLTLRKQLGK